MKTKKRELFKKDFDYLRKYFKKNKKKALKQTLYAYLFLLVAAAIVGLKLLYPYHVLVALVFVGLSLVYNYESIFSFKKKFKNFNSFRLLRLYKVGIILTAMAVLVISAILVMTPVGHRPYKNLKGEALIRSVDNDLQYSLSVMDNLEITGSDLVGSELLAKETLNLDEEQQLRARWNDFVSAMIESEQLTEKHKYFNQLIYAIHPKENSKAFIITYSLYMKKYELFLRLIDQVGDNERTKKLLNERSSVTGTENLYLDIVSRYYGPKTMLRINSGRGYLAFLDMMRKDRQYGEAYSIMKKKANESYRFLAGKLGTTLTNAVPSSADRVEDQLFDIWFPLQKNTAYVMGETYIARRHEKFITLDQVRQMQQRLQPGDIMVQRRNWYASNVGIPGFWPHAAIYTGNLEQMEQYFGELFPYEGYENVESYLAAHYPRVLEKLKQRDDSGFGFAVLEGKAEGIIMQSLEVSGRADYVGVMRPRLAKEDIFKAVIRGFGNYGKPYDYDFDFETLDELVCSELVYDAYQPMKDKQGLHFALSTVTGRKITSPTDMVRKFHDEHDFASRELDFIYFIDGNEKLKKAMVKGEEEFLTSWTRPKFDWQQE